MAFLKHVVSVMGQEFDLVISHHAISRQSARFYEVKQTKSSGEFIIEGLVSLLDDEDVADMLLNEVAVGKTAAVFDYKSSTCYLVKMELSTILVLTVFNEERYCYVNDDTYCVFVGGDGNASVEAICDTGHFRESKRSKS